MRTLTPLNQEELVYNNYNRQITVRSPTDCLSTMGLLHQQTDYSVQSYRLSLHYGTSSLTDRLQCAVLQIVSPLWDFFTNRQITVRSPTDCLSTMGLLHQQTDYSAQSYRLSLHYGTSSPTDRLQCAVLQIVSPLWDFFTNRQITVRSPTDCLSTMGLLHQQTDYSAQSYRLSLHYGASSPTDRLQCAVLQIVSPLWDFFTNRQITVRSPTDCLSTMGLLHQQTDYSAQSYRLSLHYGTSSATDRLQCAVLQIVSPLWDFFTNRQITVRSPTDCLSTMGLLHQQTDYSAQSYRLSLHYGTSSPTDRLQCAVLQIVSPLWDFFTNRQITVRSPTDCLSTMGLLQQQTDYSAQSYRLSLHYGTSSPTDRLQCAVLQIVSPLWDFFTNRQITVRSPTDCLSTMGLLQQQADYSAQSYRLPLHYGGSSPTQYTTLILQYIIK